MAPRAERRAHVGADLPRVDGFDKAAGRARYPQDLPLPDGCLHAATVRAPLACARLAGIDAARARALPGVVRVLTAADVRGTNRFGLLEADQPVLVEDVIRGASDVVALVVATSERAARAAARRVALDLVPMPGLFDPARACDVDAPVIHPARVVTRDPARAAVARHPNVVAARTIRRGDVERALARSAVVIEGVYRTDWVEHAFLAPEAGLCEPDADGHLTLHVATQWPEADLRQAATALGEPRDRLRLVQHAIGGAFGGREDVSLQILLLLAARATGRPVRMVWDRPESIRGHGKRHPFRIHHRLGADASGRLTAASVEILVDAGCYASSSAAVVDNALSQTCGPYVVPAVRLSGRAVYTNNPFTCAFRGFGVNQVTFAMEQQMSKLAAALRFDPATLRRRNLVAAGGVLASGGRVSDARGLPRTLRRATTQAARRPLPRATTDHAYGRGLACAIKNVGYGFGATDRATAEVVIDQAGARVRIGAAEVGQGVATVLTQIAADALGMPARRVRLESTDTTTSPEAGSTSASRQTMIAGNAVRLACERARRAVAARAARGLASVPLTRTATFTAPATNPIGRRGKARHACAYTWSTCVADVRVDLATGRVELVRAVVALDAGRAINPRLVSAQVEGGVVMGQGYALFERCAVRDGMPISLGFEACGIPTAVDAVPAIETILIEAADPAGPFGARGIGEITMIPVVPAITAAIHSATGVWLDEIPALPERVVAAIAIRQRELGRQ